MTNRFTSQGLLLLAASLSLSGLARGQEALAPTITHTPVATAQPGQPLTLTAMIHSSNGVFQPVLDFRRAGDSAWTKVPLLGSGGDVYAATIPGANLSGDIEYYLEAYDNDGNGPARAGSPDAPFHVAIVSAVAPRQIAAGDGALASQAPPQFQKEAAAPNGRLIGGLVSLGVGVAGAGVGTWGFISRNTSVTNSNSASPANRQQYLSEISEFTAIGVVGLAVGVAALGVGVYLIASGSGKAANANDAAPSSGLSVAPLPGGAMAAWSGRFGG